VRIEANIPDPGGLLILGDLFYPGWTAEVQSTEDGHVTGAPILRTNRVLRGVALPPGKHFVTFRYRPASVFWGALVSGAAWLALFGLAVIGIWHRRVNSQSGTAAARLGDHRWLPESTDTA
jgi:hypothetical protein